MVSVKGLADVRFGQSSRFQPVADMPPRANFFNRSRKIMGLTFGSLVAARMSRKALDCSFTDPHETAREKKGARVLGS